MKTGRRGSHPIQAPLRPIPTNCRQLRLSGWERDQAYSRDICSNGRNVIPAAKGIRIERGFGRPTDHYSTGLGMGMSLRDDHDGSKFKVGDHVTWNSEAGHVSGTILKLHTENVYYKGMRAGRILSTRS